MFTPIFFFLAMLSGYFLGEELNSTKSLVEIAYSHQAEIYRIQYSSNPNSFIGTAFAVISDSGDVHLITAGHVCDALSTLGSTAFVRLNDSSVLKIMTNYHVSKTTDLCSLGIIETDSYLELATSVRASIGFVVGFPVGYRLAAQSGSLLEIKTQQWPSPNQDDCQEPYDMVPSDPGNIISVPVCAREMDILTTNIPVAPGNSGSPVLNTDGEVVGVVSAYNTDTPMWGLMIPLKDLRAFIK